MFDKFGEFNSVEELNRKAEELKRTDAGKVLELAEENGIDREIAQCFLDGELDELADQMTMAMSRLMLESKEYDCKEIMRDWSELIMQRVGNDEKMAMAVTEKEKSLKGCIAHILKWSWENSYDVDKETVKMALGKNQVVKMGIPGSATVKKLIREYYVGG